MVWVVYAFCHLMCVFMYVWDCVFGGVVYVLVLVRCLWVCLWSVCEVFVSAWVFLWGVCECVSVLWVWECVVSAWVCCECICEYVCECFLPFFPEVYFSPHLHLSPTTNWWCHYYLLPPPSSMTSHPRCLCHQYAHVCVGHQAKFLCYVWHLMTKQCVVLCRHLILVL